MASSSRERALPPEWKTTVLAGVKVEHPSDVDPEEIMATVNRPPREFFGGKKKLGIHEWGGGLVAVRRAKNEESERLRRLFIHSAKYGVDIAGKLVAIINGPRKSRFVTVFTRGLPLDHFMRDSEFGREQKIAVAVAAMRRIADLRFLGIELVRNVLWQLVVGEDGRVRLAGYHRMRKVEIPARNAGWKLQELHERRRGEMVRSLVGALMDGGAIRESEETAETAKLLAAYERALAEKRLVISGLPASAFKPRAP